MVILFYFADAIPWRCMPSPGYGIDRPDASAKEIALVNLFKGILNLRD